MFKVTRAWLVVVLLSGCSNDTAPLSAEIQEAITEEQSASAPVANTRIADEPEDVVVEEIPAPKEWPACWLSSRLSSTEAVAKRRDKNFTTAAGRQEFRGKSANPITGGDCVMNWFGQDNPDEPWVEMLATKAGTIYDSVITCTADATPDCTCMTAIPTAPAAVPGASPADVPFIVGNCVRKTDTGRLTIYNVRNPKQFGLQPANGACDNSNHNVELVFAEKWGEIAALEDEDSNFTLSNGDSCRADVEPFAPRDDEKDWYGDEIRDWAVVTCEDEETFCRSYALFYKSGEDQDTRGSMIETGLLLICRNGKCQQVWL